MCEASADQGGSPGGRQQAEPPPPATASRPGPLQDGGPSSSATTSAASTRRQVLREELTARELALLARIDSLLFGVVRMQLAENHDKKALLEKGVRALEQVIVDVRKAKARRRRKRRYIRVAEPEDSTQPPIVNGVADRDEAADSMTNVPSPRKRPGISVRSGQDGAVDEEVKNDRVDEADEKNSTNEPPEQDQRTSPKVNAVEVKEEPMDVEEEASRGDPRVNGHDTENGTESGGDSRENRVDDEVAQLTAEIRVNGVCSPAAAGGGSIRTRSDDPSTEAVTTAAGPGRDGPNDLDLDCDGSQALQESGDDVDTLTEVPVELWAKLGHLNLLLEDYEKALSAYQQYFQRRSDSWNNLAFMYGLAMVYYHYSQFEWAIRAFREILYLEPAFCRAAEVHARLGLMYKVRGDFTESQRCFDHVAQAVQNGEKLSITSFELQFHQAHLCEVQGKLRQAKDQYEALLDNPALPRNVKAEVLRQLGWMYHSQPMDSLGLPLRTIALPPLPPQQQRQSLAIQCLQKSIECDPTSGQSLYFLGRCFAAVGKVHDAFLSYRNSVDKAEANADTWCSIGILYQQQSQPMDALQAYICAVHLDKLHSPAWLNLGVLYEAVKQPADALKCYTHALHGSLFSPDSNLNTCQMP